MNNLDSVIKLHNHMNHFISHPTEKHPTDYVAQAAQLVNITREISRQGRKRKEDPDRATAHHPVHQSRHMAS